MSSSLFVPALPPCVVALRAVSTHPSRPIFTPARLLRARRFRSVSRPSIVATLSPPPNTLPFTVFNTTVHISGRFILLLVPILWASYGICLKLLYVLPWALHPSLFNVLRLAIGCIAALPPLLAPFRDPRNRKLSVLSPLVLAGLELGMWTFLANVLQITALRHTTASRGAFLSQISTVIVPIAAYLLRMEKQISPSVILACLISVIGVAFLTLDSVSATFSLLGDGFMLLVAAVASVYILRCKVHSTVSHPDVLVSFKVIGQTAFALIYFAISYMFFPPVTAAFSNPFAGATPILILINAIIVVWAGVFISWLSTIIQVKGQALVSASEAVIIFTSMPLWAAVMAWPLGERFGPSGILGAILILGATIIAANAGRKNKKEKKQIS